MKRISEKKLEAFTVGTMGKRQLSKKELEEQKKKEDEEAAAHAFKEFVETFQNTPTPTSKVWIKAGTYDAGSRREDKSEKGKLYKPSSKLEEKSAAEKAQEYAKMLATDLKKESVPLKKRNQEKKKSNLELFKEELRQIQEEREERHKYKHMAMSQAPAPQVQSESQDPPSESQRGSGSFDTGDPNTTNLYLGNLNPKISEQQLMEIFGRYGPLASIKIMWPRSEEEKQRGRNCGFVAYMSRKDAERALKALNGRYVMSYEMRLGWGKTVPIMNQPIFVPKPLLDLTLPPPSGLPFNAQPPPSEAANLPQKNYKEYTSDEEKENMEKVLHKSAVKVFIPTEKSIINIIHRMIEFVIREGPMFEALIMSREMENPLFLFLFDNESAAHIYYRWKLFSLLQGDSPTEWNEKEFRMFKGGPVWQPPIANFYTRGMPDEFVIDPDAPVQHKGALSTAQRDRLEDLIRHLTPDRSRIGDAMIFCIEHADAADEICECISESLASLSTLASKKIARLYLISDILHNCTVKVANASFFRKSVEKYLLEIFENLHSFFNSIDSRLKAEGLKSRVINVLRTWEEWTIYPKDFLAKLRSVFLGKQAITTPPQVEESRECEEYTDDIDGAPLSGDEKEDEDLDGVPLDGAALLKGVLMRGLPETTSQLRDTPTRREVQEAEFNDDIDGIPLDDDIDIMIPLEHNQSDYTAKSNTKIGGFLPSKWETIDPEQVEAQAITTSKWDTLDPPLQRDQYDSSDDDDGDSNSRSYSEDKRQKLREIEMKAMQYQDEIESGRRELKPGWTIQDQVEYHRKKLLRKDARNEYVDSPLSYMHSRKSDSPEGSRNLRRSKRSPSPTQHYSSSSRSSPTQRNSRKRSHSPYESKRREMSPSSLSTRSGKSSKRNRSRSPSDSPKRYIDHTSHSSRSSRYDSPNTTSIARSRRSPSSGNYGSRSFKRDERDIYGGGLVPSPPRPRSDKHKHKHKH